MGRRIRNRYTNTRTERNRKKFMNRIKDYLYNKITSPSFLYAILVIAIIVIILVYIINKQLDDFDDNLDKTKIYQDISNREKKKKKDKKIHNKKEIEMEDFSKNKEIEY